MEENRAREAQIQLDRILVSNESRQPRRSRRLRGAPAPIDLVADEVLLKILRRVGGDSAWKEYALVCKRWSNLRRSVVSKLRFEKKQRWHEDDFIRTVWPFRNLVHLELARKVRLTDCFLLAASTYLKRLEVLILDDASGVEVSFSTHSLDGFLRAMPQLKELVLPMGCNLEIPASVSLLSSLTKLVCSVTLPPDGIEGVTSLKYLDLSSPAVPAAVFRLQQLTTLILRHFGTKTLPPGLAQLAGLKELSVSSSSLVPLPEEMTSLAKLRRFKLTGCTQLAQLPHSIGRLKQLTSLELSDCGVKELPDSIGDLEHLSVLVLYWLENLTALPPSLTRLTGLTRLKMLGNARLLKIPKQLLLLPLLYQGDKSGIKKAIDRVEDPGVKALLATKTIM